MRFASPARAFGESSPTGNGRLGASDYGGIQHERLSLNENSMWSGSVHDSDRPDAYKDLPEIRRLLLAGDNVAAEALVNKSFTSVDAGSADQRYGSYQELGRLDLDFVGLDENKAVAYSRVLDLDAAVVTTTFTIHGVTYTREVFTSVPDQVVVVRLRASQSHALSFDLHLRRAERFASSSVGSNELLMTGELDSGAAEIRGVRYAARVRALAQGGNLTASGDAIHVRAADTVSLLVTAATDYNGFAGRHTVAPAAASAADLQRATRQTTPDLLRRHKADYQPLFRRVKLQLGEAASEDLRPTAERLRAASAGAPDPGLAALYFQFGRYLLISSSRPGGLPANLQGLWAEGTQTPWNGDWHLNVNVQMNYWPAESTGLGNLSEPLLALVESLQAPGTRTALHYYAAEGWVAHTITNAWGYTSPGEQASWGSTVVGSAWLCQSLWNHYLYTGDETYLRRIYPILKGSSEFYLSMLVREAKHGWLVTAPSNSPENTFYLPSGAKASVCLGPAIDEEVLRFLFTATAEAEDRLHRDAELRERLLAVAPKLAPIQIGADGRILEWLEPYREVDPQHRHVSHLWALYPDAQIDAVTTPTLAEAARRTLEVRGDEATGWSRAYKSLLWARLGDGDHAYRLLAKLWQPVDAVRQDAAGSLPNLWDSGPPFQIDGNFGGTAAIAEMLLASRPGELRLLPALPSAWAEGTIKGLHGMNGVIVDIAWRKGQLLQSRLSCGRAGPVLVRYNGQVLSLRCTAGQEVTVAAQANGSLAFIR